MSTIPARKIERNRNKPDSRITHVHRRQALATTKKSAASPWEHMRVKLCARCPYAPRDLAGHYDPAGVLHVCAKCDGERETSNNHYPRTAHRRQKCATGPNIFGTAQPSAARSVTESLASSGTTPGELRSVQRSALTASRPVGTTTADGCVDFKPPDNACASIMR